MIIIAFLLLAWIMTLFEMDIFITEGINEFFNKYSFGIKSEQKNSQTCILR